MPELFKRGILLAIEGIDGAGKTTQAALLASCLRAAGQDPLVSKEPTNGYWGQKIRNSARQGRLSLEEELRTLIYDRSEHVQTVVQPALEAGRIVILDRYFYSTIAYQGSRGADLTALKAEMESRFPIPDAVFLLDLDASLAISRIRNSRKEVPNVFERLEVLEHVRDVFNSLQGPIIRVDGTKSQDLVHRTIMNAFVHGLLETRDSGDWPHLLHRLLSESEPRVAGV